MDDVEIKCRIVEKLLRKRVIGNHKWSIDTTVAYALPSHAQGRGRHLIKNEMLPSADAGLTRYGGGARDNIHLTSAQDAVEFLREHDGNVPFG